MTTQPEFDDEKFASLLEADDAKGAEAYLDSVLSAEPDRKEAAAAILALEFASIGAQNEINSALVSDLTFTRDRLAKLKALEQKNEEGEKADQIRADLNR